MTDHVVCARADLSPGRLTRGVAGRMPVLLTLVGDQPVAIAARCPHQGADLGGGCVVEFVDAAPDGHLITDPARPIAAAPDTRERPAELSDLIVFDYLTQNVDRWGGDFTNVRSLGPGGPLIYLDNGAGFWLGEQRLGLMEARLKALQRFRRSTIEAVRRLDIERFGARLGADPLAPVLNEKQLDGLAQRRRAVLQHVDAMVARFGEREVLAW